MYSTVVPLVLLSVFLLPAARAACNEQASVACHDAFEAERSSVQSPTNEQICAALVNYKSCMTTACGGTLTTEALGSLESLLTGSGGTCPVPAARAACNEQASVACHDAFKTLRSSVQSPTNEQICAALANYKSCMTTACGGTLTTEALGSLESLLTGSGGTCPDLMGGGNGASMLAVTTPLKVVAAVLVVFLFTFLG